MLWIIMWYLLSAYLRYMLNHRVASLKFKRWMLTLAVLVWGWVVAILVTFVVRWWCTSAGTIVNVVHPHSSNLGTMPIISLSLLVGMLCGILFCHSFPSKNPTHGRKGKIPSHCCWLVLVFLLLWHCLTAASKRPMLQKVWYQLWKVAFLILLPLSFACPLGPGVVSGAW